MPTITTDDGINIDYVLDDFTDPWEDGKEVIGLLHGSTLNKKFYGPMVPYLGRRFKVLRWDQRGRGLSSAPPPGSTLSGEAEDDGVNVGRRYAKDALSLMDQLGIEKIHWVGDSSGGITGANFAYLFPDRIKTLTCIQSPLVKIPEDFAKAWAAGEETPAAAIAKYGMAKYYEIIGTDWVTDPGKGSENFHAWQRAERKKIETHTYVGHWIWQLDADLTKELPHIQTPTQLLCGDKGGICPIEQQERIQKLMPNCTLKIYENTGHGIAFQEPQKAAEDVMEFIDKNR
ncbi:alpha/beta hydrolase [Aureimonas fodinaquatilis]|uniref:Alpha/beta hydrolase n=1 Tax=Aureimonas fodinaquatilis TaxID=2565783 RepID=A0A5B0DUM4_9HYPH|nr:alpha/beta hydrolase [Aureimonas fodinaquatilis]KAA0968909.1 alpha/beta hydrolase [Aureimonas fodinaquatilis]